MKYIVNINERTAKGRALRAFLKADGIDIRPLKTPSIMDEIEESLKEVKQMREGKQAKKTLGSLLNGK
jgi:hypothetical protein